MKRSPRPWHVNAIGFAIGGVKRAQILGDESISQGVDYYTINNHNSTVAKIYRPRDAALIVTAPELLEHLKNAYACMVDILENGIEDRESISEVISEWKSATDKAEGRR